MSSNTEEMEQKKKSQAIDRILEEDSKKLRRECKILLLGMVMSSPHPRARSLTGARPQALARAANLRL